MSKAIHYKRTYKKHNWEKNSKGEIDTFAWDNDFHNGPYCKRCGYSFCVHCNPKGYNKEPCIVEYYRCPYCKKLVRPSQKFCDECGFDLREE